MNLGSYFILYQHLLESQGGSATGIDRLTSGTKQRCQKQTRIHLVPWLITIAMRQFSTEGFIFSIKGPGFTGYPCLGVGGVGNVTWLLIRAYNEMWKGREKQKKLLSKIEPETREVENPQSIHIAKQNETKQNEKACVKEITTGMARQPHHKEVDPQPAPQKPGIKMGLFQEKDCQPGLTETANGQNEGRLLDFWDLTG